MKNLLEAGVHFGHQTRKWDPRMAPYIFTARNGIHIIDLQKTVQMAKMAYEALREFTHRGEKVLFVGTKKQARGAIEREAKRCNMYYVNNRWLGGILTNWRTIRKSIDRLLELSRVHRADHLLLNDPVLVDEEGLRGTVDAVGDRDLAVHAARVGASGAA